MTKRNSDVRARFAQRLRAIRIPRGYKTARSFAEALGIDENRYTRYERAEVEPDLQLLMRICGLLEATPNDLLSDTIGSTPLDVDVPYGFAERTASGYQAGGPQYAARPAAPTGDTRDDARKLAAWQLAEVVAGIEARAAGTELEKLPPLEQLRAIGPLHAMIAADHFGFLSALPDRLQGIDVDPETQDIIHQLTQELIAASKPPANDNP